MQRGPLPGDRPGGRGLWIMPADGGVPKRLTTRFSTAARVLNAPQIGSIAQGQLADLVILDANPIDDIGNTRRIREVIQGGRIVDRDRLRSRGLR
jgi:cytosine/adenosine deaminase-related metal-dependent hydrolase